MNAVSINIHENSIMTPEELDAIEVRAAKATEGPWNTHLVDDTCVVSADRTKVCTTCDSSQTERDDGYNIEYERMEKDAAFIAHARQDVPALIAALREAQAENARLKAINANLMGDDEDKPRYTTKRLRHRTAVGY